MFDPKADFKEWKKIVYKNGKAFSSGKTPAEQYVNYLNDCKRFKPQFFVDMVLKDIGSSKYVYRELVMGCIQTYRWYEYALSNYSNEELCDMAMDALKKAGKIEREAWRETVINPIPKAELKKWKFATIQVGVDTE